MTRFRAVLILAASALLAGSLARAQSEVVLQEKGDAATLSNGIVTATLSKSKAQITSLKYRGSEMLRAGYYSMDGGKSYRSPSGCEFAVKTRTPDLVDVAMKRAWKNDPRAVDIEVHYVLRRGDSGLYSYAILSHPASYPATRVGEWRFVWKLPPDLLEHIFVDDLRNWRMQSSRDPFEPTPIKEIIRITGGIRAGQYDCKYDFNANYWDLGCWGHASDKNRLGAWVVLGSHEYFNDGPTKQDLTAATGIIHLHFGMNHYNGSPIEVPAKQHWSKTFGPFLLYCNTAPTAKDCWADAKTRAETEQRAWPYGWLTNNPNYPLAAQRGTLGGRLVVSDPLKPHLAGAGAWVGLAQPPSGGNWQFESLGYQHWTKADAQGHFALRNIRPGNYTLYAFTDGAVGEFSQPGIRIEPGNKIQLPDITWNIPHKGSCIAWEIGIPDRTAKEFRHGTDYFRGYLWQKFSEEFPNPLEFIIGKSDAAKDWNYAQTRYVRPDGSIEPHTWRIRFNLPEAPSGDATLTVAIASADRARIRIFANSSSRPIADVTPKVQGGNALLREGIHAKYCVEYVTIPRDQLVAGENSIDIALTNPSNPAAHVMYDYLSLELP